MDISTIVIIVVIIALVWFLIGVYNRLVALKNQYENAFAQIEVQLKRRYDLIPNLVETAKGYLSHERETLEAVISARNAASNMLANAAKNMDAGSIKELGNLEGQLAGAMGQLNVVMEAYPDLKANQNMMQLSEELTSTENKVAFSRQAYNDSVTEYNTYRQSFPNNVVAANFGHKTDAELLEFADSEQIQAAPEIKF